MLSHIAATYMATHQFKDAATYYQRALQQDPADVALRTKFASCLYYQGDVDGALAQLHQSLKYDPRDANSLFNLGVMLFQGKNDAAGAIEVWQTLLKTYPNLKRRPIVERLIAEARQTGATRAAATNDLNARSQ